MAAPLIERCVVIHRRTALHRLVDEGTKTVSTQDATDRVQQSIMLSRLRRFAGIGCFILSAGRPACPFWRVRAITVASEGFIISTAIIINTTLM